MLKSAGFFILLKNRNLPTKKMKVYIVFNGAGQVRFIFSKKEDAESKVSELFRKWRNPKYKKRPHYYIGEFDVLG